MFRGFDVRGVVFRDASLEQVARDLREARRKQVQKRLEAFLADDGSIDGTKLQDDWFPEIHADIFLSHSHADETQALRLAGWIKSRFNLDVFIDSSVWGNASELLQAIDERYCKNPDGQTFSYERRNLSTSHVHMMLATALAKMIDGAECAWVLNTANSITSKEAIDSTKSPWLFSEIAAMHVVRRRTPEFHRGRTKIAKAQREMVEALSITHQVSLKSFTRLDVAALNKWAEARGQSSNAHKHALDILYELVPDQIPAS